MVVIEKSADTVDIAIDLALAELNVDMDQVECQIITRESKGFLGFGAKKAVVRVTYGTDEPVAIKKEQKPVKSKPVAKKATPAPAPKKEAVKAETITETQISTIDKSELTPAYVEKKALEFLEPIFASLKVKPKHSVEIKDDVIWLIFTGKGLGCVIGRRGETLDSLQYLTNLTVNLGLAREDKFRVVLDVEGYRSNRNDTLASLAEKMAEKVKKTGKDVVLEPMSPHERRVIHMTLQGISGIKTYSQGEEPYRRVVICKK